MEAVTYSTFRDHMKSYMDRARDDVERFMVTSRDPSATMVTMNIRDYENLIENDYIKSNAYLMGKIAESRAQFERGDVKVHDLVEDEGEDD